MPAPGSYKAVVSLEQASSSAIPATYVGLNANDSSTGTARRKLPTVGIIGAGMAGSTAAMALADAGFPVLLFEKQAEAPDVLRGEVISPAGVYVLDELGAGDALRQVCRETEGLSVHHPGFVGKCLRLNFKRSIIPSECKKTHRLVALAGWRKTMHDALQGHLRRRSKVRYFQPCENQQLERCDDQWRITTSAKATFDVDLVVGADGAQSRVRKVGNLEPLLSEHPTTAFGCMAHCPGFDSSYVFVIHHPIGSLYIFPFPDGYFRCFFEFLNEFRPEVEGKDSLAHFLQLIEPALPDEFWRLHPNKHITPCSKLHIQRGQHVAMDRIVGDGVALIGDAAGCADPVSGLGMARSIWDGWELAQTLIRSAGDITRSGLQPYEEAHLSRIGIQERVTALMSHLFLDKSHDALVLPYARYASLRWREPSIAAPTLVTQFAGFPLRREPYRTLLLLELSYAERKFGFETQSWRVA